jgi:hypothetical protein
VRDRRWDFDILKLELFVLHTSDCGNRQSAVTPTTFHLLSLALAFSVRINHPHLIPQDIAIINNTHLCDIVEVGGSSGLTENAYANGVMPTTFWTIWRDNKPRRGHTCSKKRYNHMIKIRRLSFKETTNDFV